MRLHLVDGTFELFRAHYAPRPERDHKATVGLVLSMLGLLGEQAEAVTHIAIAFDNPIRSFRNQWFAGYKSDQGVDPVLRAQFDDAEEAARALGLVVWSMDRFECDDALATAVARWKGSVEQVRILSPDKDFGQCLDGGRVVLVDRIRRRETDQAAYFAKFGLHPPSVPDYLALVGDTADGIPGLPGIGAKSASALLSAYGHLEAIPDDPSRWRVKLRGADRIAEVLRTRREEALLYRRLATLVTDVPLAESLDDLAFRGVPRERALAWAARMKVDLASELARVRMKSP
ncbi:MAG TPA: 5'-3' exonuclease H3TH domain-containing protein [Polyangia bacterium]|nr:5'-3' exonuclease H3TH domain-containing protein [Polyangia bacterium]